jgi:hypothetical protein
MLTQRGQERCRPWYIFQGIFIETPLHNLFSNIKVDIWHPAVGLRCIIQTRHLCQLKTRAIPLTLNPSGKQLCRLSVIFRGICIGFPTKSKYQSWYFTPCCGLEVQYPTYTIKLFKVLGNTFDLSPKWQRTLHSFGNFSWDMYRVHPKSKYQSWYLTPCCGLEVQYPT